MKLVSGREFKNDVSDIVGILLDANKNGKNISKADIDKAMIKLYGSWDFVSKNMKKLLDEILKTDNLEMLYKKTSEDENNNKIALLNFNMTHKEKVKEENIDSILRYLKD